MRTHFFVFLKEALLFGGVQGLALLAAWRIEPASAQDPAVAMPGSSPSEILLILGAAIVFILLLMRFRAEKSAAVLRILWLLALLGGTSMFFAAFFGENIALPLAILLVLIYAKAATIGYHNFVLVVGLAGIGATLGAQIAPSGVIFLLAVLSIYDVIAVYWTGHMVKMAQSFIGSGVVPGIVVSVERGGPLWVHEVRPGEEATILGTGDLVLPAILAASAFKTAYPAAGVAAALGAIAGLFFMHRIFFGQKERRPMPALPPIALGAIGGFLIAMQFV